MKNKVLKNEESNKILNTDGYIIVDVFSSHVIDNYYSLINVKLNDLNNIIKQNTNKIITVSYHSTFLENDKQYKKIVWDILNDFFKPVLKEYLANAKIIQTNIFNKPPGKGFVCPHQNLTTVDENMYTSLSIWVPLQDTNEKNGTLYLLPKSHKKFEKYRNTDIHWSPAKTPAFSIEDYKMIPINLKKGQALIFDDSIIHSSPDNLSSQNRIVFHCIAIPSNTCPIYCHKKDNFIEIYEVEDSFWHFYTPGINSFGGKFLKKIPFAEKKYHKETLLNEL